MESLFNSERIMDEQIDDHVSSSSSINGEEEEEEGKEVNSPLQDMSSLLLQLPLKRGLSKHYNGKSRSFTSLSNVRCVEDVAKTENPFNRKLKICKSYGGGFTRKQTSKKGTLKLNMGSHHIFSGFNGIRTHFNINTNKNNGKPPIPPARTIDQQVA